MSKLSCSLIAVLVLILFVSVSPSLSRAAETDSKELGFWFEGRVDSKKTSQLVGWYEHEFTDMFGVYGLVNMENNDRYRQAYAGITMKPSSKLSWLQIGAGLGRERDNESSGVRRNLFVSVDAEKIYGFGTLEDGPLTGRFHRVHLVYHLNDTFSVGAMKESGSRLGGRGEWHINKKTIAWVTVFPGRAVVGMSSSF